MRIRTCAAIGGSILALGLSALAVPAASARPSAPGSTPLPVACQSNLSYAFDTLQAVPAQKFPPPNANLNSVGGASFLVAAGGSCTVNYLVVYGRLSGPGPVPKVNIMIKNDGTTPGGLHKPTGPNLAPGNTNLVPTPLGSPAGYYNMSTNLASPITVSAPPASPARFWVVFQVRMNPLNGGKWTWEVTQPDPSGVSDVWRNQPGGFGCGAGWKVVSDPCLGAAPGKGLMMEVGT